MEKDGLLKGEWEVSLSSKPSRAYSLKQLGFDQVESETQRLKTFIRGVFEMLERRQDA
jgi:hypothetical protein